MSNWLAALRAGRPGFEDELVERYTRRLLEFARKQLPERIRQRLDPEDVVQSVYRSFFRRLNEGRFSFEDSYDVWRLLAAMTYHKAQDAVKFHLRERRDVRRETALASEADAPVSAQDKCADEVALLYDCLNRLLSGLSETHRAIVVRRLEGDTPEQISEHVGCSRRTVFRTLAYLYEVAAHQLEQPT